ncbi:hypothetical protein [Bacteroides caccae]|uniref:hypothetical protein n=1 Tax=Bacteroides caccae TaxID=47678 RepID=UPI0039908B12
MLRYRYYSVRIPVLLIRHGCDEFFSQLWRAPFTAVANTLHGCGELIITAAFANNHYLITDEYLLYDGCLMGA